MMVLEAGADTRWLDDDEAGLVYKEVTGDFVLETQVRVHDGDLELAAPTIRLGGIMLRDPDDAGGENHVVWTVGHGDTDQMYTFRFQNTVDGVTHHGAMGFPAVAFLELRLCRVGDEVILVRMTGRGWMVWNTYTRPELADTLQVGMTAFSDNAPPNLVAEFESVTFTVPATSADLRDRAGCEETRRPRDRRSVMGIPDLPLLLASRAALEQE